MVLPWQLTVYAPTTDTDDEIQRVVGKEPWAIGMGFGQRDMLFDFVSEERAIAAGRRVMELQLTGVCVDVSLDEDEVEADDAETE